MHHPGPLVRICQGHTVTFQRATLRQPAFVPARTLTLGNGLVICQIGDGTGYSLISRRSRAGAKRRVARCHCLKTEPTRALRTFE